VPAQRLPNTAYTVIVFFIEAIPHWFQVKPKSARLTAASASSRTSPEPATDTRAGNVAALVRRGP
jgi:hypothetical protein